MPRLASPRAEAGVTASGPKGTGQRNCNASLASRHPDYSASVDKGEGTMTRLTRRRARLAGAILIVCGAASARDAMAQDCSTLSPNPEAFRLSIQDSRTREADLRQKLKGQNGIRVALSLLRRYDALVVQALSTVDDMETKANLVQERHCPGWDQPDKMAETALVIKNLKARYKKQRADLAEDVAKLETALNKGQRGTVSVTFD